MAEEEPPEMPERCGAPQGEIISISDKRWLEFKPKEGDVLEVRFTATEAEIEAMAFLVTGVLEDGPVEPCYLETSHEELGKTSI